MARRRMTRAEWHAVLATRTATPNQRGRIMAECARLGINDRAERLAICAEIAGLSALGSTRDLTQGDAGRIVRALQDCTDRAILPAAAGRDGEDDYDGEDQDERQAVAGERGPTLAQAIAAALVAVLSAWQDRARPARDGLGGPR